MTARMKPWPPGQVRVHIEHFALTSNNITYAAFGEAMNYWRFYPTGDDGWGTIPVWGFATVVESTQPEVRVGERVYGYFPMASEVVLTPVRVQPDSWFDGAPHRAELHPVYNQLRAARPIRSTRLTPRTCRRCCARCSSPRG